MCEICDESNFTYDISALNQIARMSDGAARDSLSILDQCFAANTEKHITKEILSNVLGLVTEETIYELVQSINESDAKKVLFLLYEYKTKR